MFFFFKQKTAYEMRISDWSSDVCSSDLHDFQPFVLADQPVDVGDARAAEAAGIVGEDDERDVAVGVARPRAGIGLFERRADRVDRLGDLAVALRFDRFGNELGVRSEGRLVGKEGGCSCRFWWSPY